MAVTALPSKFALRWNTLCAVICLLVAGYFYYDGHYNKEYIEKEMIDGKPSIDLQINRTYGPIGCVITAMYLGYMVYSLSKKKVVVDDNGLTFSDGKNIPLDCLTKIDKSKLKNKGRLLIEYEDGDKVATVELRDTVYDGVNEVLAEILKLTAKESGQSEEV